MKKWCLPFFSNQCCMSLRDAGPAPRKNRLLRKNLLIWTNAGGREILTIGENHLQRQQSAPIRLLHLLNRGEVRTSRSGELLRRILTIVRSKKKTFAVSATSMQPITRVRITPNTWRWQYYY